MTDKKRMTAKEVSALSSTIDFHCSFTNDEQEAQLPQRDCTTRYVSQLQQTTKVTFKVDFVSCTVNDILSLIAQNLEGSHLT